MKKLGFLNKVPAKCESSTPEFDQVKAGKIGWTSHLGDAKRALSRKAKGFSFPLTSSSTPYLFSTAPPPPKRAPSTTLTLRSKSMTAELEELGECGEAGFKRQTLFFLLGHFSAFTLSKSHFPWLVLFIFIIFFSPSFCSEKTRR